MDLKDLETFIKLAKYSSFSEAAERMHIAQSALSRRILRLEHRLGIQLLVRHARGSELTREGEILAERGKEIFAQFEELQQFLRTMVKEPAGQVHLGLTPIAAQFLAPRVFAAVAARYPQVEVVLHEYPSDGVFAGLKEGKLDVGCLYSEYTYEEFDATALMREPLYLVGSPKLMAASGITQSVVPIEIVCDLPLVLPEDMSLRRILDHVCELRGVTPPAVVSAAGTNTAKGMIAAGRGFSILPYPSIYNEAQTGQIAYVKIEPKIYWYMQMATRLNQVPWQGIVAVKEALADEVGVLLQTGYWHGSLV